MVFNEKEKTALTTSVGADERQSNQNSNNIISTIDEHFNDSGEIYEENLQEMFFRMSHPYYLHTVSMTELYQTPYKSRPPIIDGLLYGGAYILAGAHITSAQAKNCGTTMFTMGRCCISHWRTITRESKDECL